MTSTLERQITPIFSADDESPGSLLVSVVIPCLNEAENIERCVLAARDGLAGVDGKGEVIVVDNASEDDSARLAAQAGAPGGSERRPRYRKAYPPGLPAPGGGVTPLGPAQLCSDASTS